MVDFWARSSLSNIPIVYGRSTPPAHSWSVRRLPERLVRHRRKARGHRCRASFPRASLISQGSVNLVMDMPARRPSWPSETSETAFSSIVSTVIQRALGAGPDVFFFETTKMFRTRSSPASMLPSLFSREYHAWLRKFETLPTLALLFPLPLCVSFVSSPSPGGTLLSCSRSQEPTVPHSVSTIMEAQEPL